MLCCILSCYGLLLSFLLHFICFYGVDFTCNILFSSCVEGLSSLLLRFLPPLPLLAFLFFVFFLISSFILYYIYKMTVNVNILCLSWISVYNLSVVAFVNKLRSNWGLKKEIIYLGIVIVVCDLFYIALFCWHCMFISSGNAYCNDE